MQKWRNEGTEKIPDMKKTSSKIDDTDLTFSITTLNVNELNTPIKRY